MVECVATEERRQIRTHHVCICCTYFTDTEKDLELALIYRRLSSLVAVRVFFFLYLLPRVVQTTIASWVANRQRRRISF